MGLFFRIIVIAGIWQWRTIKNEFSCVLQLIGSKSFIVFFSYFSVGWHRGANSENQCFPKEIEPAETHQTSREETN